MDSPQSPNPYTTAMMQSSLNTQAAQQQQRMNMTNQSSPYGSLTYSSDPNSPSGYSANQSFTPGVQANFDANLSNSTGAANQAGTILNSGAMTKPLDLSWDATAQHIADLNKSSLDPIWKDRQNTFDQTMANKGLVPGSAAYDAASRDFGTQRDNSYNDMLLKAHQQSVSDLTSQWQSPFNAFSSLRSGSQIQNGPSMGFTTTPQESVSAPNYAGMVQQDYQNQLSQSNAMMGGLFGLGGAIGGAALKYGGAFM